MAGVSPLVNLRRTRITAKDIYKKNELQAISKFEAILMLPAQEPGLVAIQTTDIENVCNSKPNTRRETTNDMGRNLCNTEKADRCGCVDIV